MRSGMIEEIPARQLRYRFSHELVRRALYDRLAGLRRAELHLQVAEAMEASGAADTAARTGRPRAPLRRRRAASTAPSGRSSTTCARPPPPTTRWRSTRRSAPLRTALELGVDNDDRARRDRAGAGRRALPGRSVRRCPRGVPGGGRDRRGELDDAGSSGTRRDRVRGRPAGGWRCSTRARSSCWRRRWRRSIPATPTHARAAALGAGPSACAAWASPSAAPCCATRRSTIARRMDYRPGLSVVLMRSLLGARLQHPRRGAGDADRGAHHRRGARRHRARRRRPPSGGSRR